MIVTFSAAARSRAATRSPRSISRGAALGTGTACSPRPTPCRRRPWSSRYQPGAGVSTARITLIWRCRSPAHEQAWVVTKALRRMRCVVSATSIPSRRSSERKYQHDQGALAEPRHRQPALAREFRRGGHRLPAQPVPGGHGSGRGRLRLRHAWTMSRTGRARPVRRLGGPRWRTSRSARASVADGLHRNDDLAALRAALLDVCHRFRCLLERERAVDHRPQHASVIQGTELAQL